MKKLVIFGAGAIAELAYFYFKHDSNYDVVAFTVDKSYIQTPQFCNLPLVAFEEIIDRYPPSQYSMFIAISYVQLNTLRTEKYLVAKKNGYKIASYISSKATTWTGLVTGENCFILENNVIQPFVKIGNNVTLWSGNHIGHHATIEDNCFISSHVVVSGGVTIKENCFIGVNATLRDHIIIAKNNILSASALILKNTVENGVYMGSPAKLAKVPSNRLKKI